MPTRLAVLNSMLGSEVERSFARQAELGLRDLDLKDQLFGKKVLELTDEEAGRVAGLAGQYGLRVYCLSTQLFDDDVGRGEEYFAEQHRARVPRALELAAILGAHLVRLLACRWSARPAGVSLGESLRTQLPWVLKLYREAIQTVAETGRMVTIENEVRDCVLAGPDDVRSLFDALGLDGLVNFTWDVQNMWALGTWPSLDVYHRLRPLIGYVHLKGGRADETGTLRWRSSLRDASWPVREITAQVVADDVSPVICLNPSHGEAPPGYDKLATAEDDVRFLRELSIGVE